MTQPNPKDPQAELREAMEKLLTTNIEHDGSYIPVSAIRKKIPELQSVFQAHQQEARISTLKRFSHVPPPHDEEWSEEFQKGVEHGVLLSQQKLRFEIQRLKKQSKIGELNG